MVKVSKKYNRDFTVIQNSFFKFNEKLPKEDKLGFKEAGIFWYLWHLPNDWEFHESEIINHFKDKIDSFRTGRQKLEKYGFIKKVRNRNKQGQVGAYEWTLDDDPPFPPSLDFPTQGKPTLEKPTQENPHVQNTNTTKDVSNKVLSSSDDSESPQITAIDAWTNNWEFPNVINRDDIFRWVNELGNDLVVLAIQNAGHNNVSSRGAYRYVKKTIEEWKNQHIDTVEQAEQQITEHEHMYDRNVKGYKSKKPAIDRKIPESFKEEYDPEKDKLSEKDKSSLEKELAEFYKRGKEEQE